MKYLELIRKYAIIVVIALTLIGLGVWKFLKKKGSSQSNEANELIQGTDFSDTEKALLITKATQVAHHLGTAYPSADPRSWTENDKEVYDLLKNVTKKEFDVISDLYFKIYAKGKNLSADLVRLLDNEFYKLLTIK